MSINQANKDKPVFCISCGKMICKGHIESGSIEIPCKCGVKNRIEADKKPEGRKEIAYEPGYDSRGRMVEISIVKRRTS